jgi:cob(I)alamin adenosyltransferase
MAEVNEEKRTRLKQGEVQVYTGNGKGKTTAAFGLALRAAGCNMHVVIIQFMKVSGHYAEDEGIRRLGSCVEHYAFGNPGWVKKGEGTEADYAQAKAGMDKAREALQDPDVDLVILDEINNALYFELVTEADVLDLMKTRRPEIELVLTGRNAPEAIIDAADLVTEMREIKHYYTKGVPVRRGIEF